MQNRSFQNYRDLRGKFIDKISKHKQLDKTWLESESETSVADNSDSYFSDESDTETMDSVAPNDNSASLGTFFMLPLFDVGNESVTEPLQKKQKTIVSLY